VSRLALSVAAGLVVMTTFCVLAATGALALWRDRATVDAQSVKLSRIALGVQRPGSPAAYAPSVDAGAHLVLTSEDASRLIDEPGIAIAFDVLLRADGNAGLSYSLAFGQPGAGTLFAAAAVEVFPVDSPDQCLFGATGDGASLTDIPGLSTTFAETKVQTHHWCVTAQLDPTQLPHYTNTGSVTGTGAGIAVEASDTWDVTLLPDPAAEPDIHLTVWPQVLRPHA
jgi:hypothetical protein